MGLTPDPSTVPDTFTPDRRKLTEENFDDTYDALVSTYDRSVPLQAYPQFRLAETASPSSQSGASGTGRLYLNVNEDAELNIHMPAARDDRIASSVCDTLASVLVFIPDLFADLQFWGLGGHTKLFGGSSLSEASKIAAEILRTKSAWEQDQGGMAGARRGTSAAPTSGCCRLTSLPAS